MTPSQEEALYDFLDNTAEPFELGDAVSFILTVDPERARSLTPDVEAFINFRSLAFPLGDKRWVSRRGFFEPLPFVLSPSRMELVNGILIPGHRCIPFANSGILPNEYSFFWQDKLIPFTSSEGPPEDFYPFYNVLGEEYAPQYVARDNSENEEAFNDDPFDDPEEVSIKTIDMRNIYREASFVPGDCFVVRTLDWKQGHFQLEKVGKDEWGKAELDAWVHAAEEGFELSFSKMGPASCTEEQIAFAYWFGPSRMKELPACSLEDFLYEKTGKIKTTAYGIETRFWYAGREIQDGKELDNCSIRPDTTPIEVLMLKLKIPVSEFVIQAYVRDSLYREDGDEDQILKRLVPARVELSGRDRDFLSEYISSVLDEFREIYNPFTDKKMGPIRSRAGELHTAVIDLASMLNKGDIDASWLPRHTFIILSQIQSHTAAVMEDLVSDEPLPDMELEAIDNSLDSMIETYEDVKELIDEALDSFRRNKLALVRSGSNSQMLSERLLQLSISGLDVWRRIIVPDNCTLGELHEITQAIFGWQNTENFRFSGEDLDLETKLKDLEADNTVELLYEYGTKWAVRIMILSRQESSASKAVRCVAGAGAAPPESVPGPLKFRRLLYMLENGSDMERLNAGQELGSNFSPEKFDLDACNLNLRKNVNRS
jgi:hypothetical protein